MNPDLIEMLSRWAPIVHIENDASLAAVAEGAWGAAVGCRDYVSLLAGARLGAGVVVDGRLLRGAHGGAGEMVFLDDIPTVGGAGGWDSVPRNGRARRSSRAMSRADSGLLTVPLESSMHRRCWRSRERAMPMPAGSWIASPRPRDHGGDLREPVRRLARRGLGRHLGGGRPRPRRCSRSDSRAPRSAGAPARGLAARRRCRRDRRCRPRARRRPRRCALRSRARRRPRGRTTSISCANDGCRDRSLRPRHPSSSGGSAYRFASAYTRSASRTNSAPAVPPSLVA